MEGEEKLKARVGDISGVRDCVSRERGAGGMGGTGETHIGRLCRTCLDGLSDPWM